MLLIQNGHIKTMVGADLENGCILLGDDGKILSVAAEIAESVGCTVIDAEGRLVTPGLVEGRGHIGVDETTDWDYTTLRVCKRHGNRKF